MRTFRFARGVCRILLHLGVHRRDILDDSLLGTLSPVQARLFLSMQRADQVHGLATAKKCQKLAAQHGLASERRRLLLQTALLHDVGKSVESVGILARVVHGLPMEERWKAILLSFSRRQGKQLLVLAAHAQLGADLLREAGSDAAVVAMVADHHGPASQDILLQILQTCDEQS